MPEFPNKEERSVCWGSRDKYWSCLDKFAPEFNRNNVKEKEPEACKELRKFYETVSCLNRIISS